MAITASIEIISLNFLWRSEDGKIDLDPVSLPRLHTLNVSGMGSLNPFLEWCAHCTLPSLNTLKIDCQDHNLGSIIPIFQAYESKLTTLIWNVPIYPDDEIPSLEDCSSLLNITISVGSGPIEMLSSLSTHPTLPRIVLDDPLFCCPVDQTDTIMQSYQRRYLPGAMSTFDRCMAMIRSLPLSRLRSVRMQGLLPDYLTDPIWDGRAGFWTRWIDSWSARNVRFEDTYGALLVVPETWGLPGDERK
jgi:hypothetical protein